MLQICRFPGDVRGEGDRQVGDGRLAASALPGLEHALRRVDQAATHRAQRHPTRTEEQKSTVTYTMLIKIYGLRKCFENNFTYIQNQLHIMLMIIRLN